MTASPNARTTSERSAERTENATADVSSDATVVRTLVAQLEEAWNVDRTSRLVDRLATEYPKISGALYDAFATLVQGDLHRADSHTTVAGVNARTQSWSMRHERAMVSDAHRAAVLAPDDAPPPRVRAATVSAPAVTSPVAPTATTAAVTL